MHVCMYEYMYRYICGLCKGKHAAANIRTPSYVAPACWRTVTISRLKLHCQSVETGLKQLKNQEGGLNQRKPVPDA